MMRCLSSVVVIFTLIALAGCGFHLRGEATIPDNLKVIYVQGVEMNKDLGRELKRNLTNNGVTVVSDYQKDSAILTVVEYKVDRRVLSVGSDAKVNEYELYGIVDFKISDAEGQLLSDQQRVEARRDFQFDENQVIGTTEEARLLREQIDQQLVQSMLRRLAAIK
jgi:LPS-assembly lipoprotein